MKCQTPKFGKFSKFVIDQVAIQRIGLPLTGDKRLKRKGANLKETKILTEGDRTKNRCLSIVFKA